MDAEVALARAAKGQGKSTLFLGLRGVGKTVLLIRISQGGHASVTGNSRSLDPATSPTT